MRPAEKHPVWISAIAPSRENANTVNHSPGRDRSRITTAHAIKGKTIFNNSTLPPNPGKPELNIDD